MGDHRFIADDMVRRLGRWLRTIGCDTAYAGALSDSEVAELARSEGRILVTRDQRFGERYPDVRVYALREENPWRQFVLVVREFGLDLESGFLSRCTICNAPLERVDREPYRNRIPPFSFESATEFYRCPACDKLYWDGAHVRRMRGQLREIREAVENGGE